MPDKKQTNFSKAALDYHKSYPAGKIEVIPSKPHATQRDLSLAYSPGVAEPCLAIHNDISKVYDYTSKGNLVAVISNGTAVLGLGDIGAEASKPVMEGKGLLFKIFADINVFDIEINEKDPEKFIEIVKGIAPTFGGINLEDIKAPEAFLIEKRLKEELSIPLMHDDQHGTAIISAAALINALELAGKKIADVKVIVNGAGAAAISCSKLYMAVGVRKENLIMCDSKGVLNSSRENLTEEKLEFVNTNTTANTLEEAIVGADVFIGLSKADILTPAMLKTMAANPVVFALANPNPEINYNLALETRADVLMATGRSDYPNQVNNVLGFPYIFRGALDVQAKCINEEMKLAAVYALANLAKEPVPEVVLMAYGLKQLSFGKEYFIPKPFDGRLITRVSMAVAKAAMDSQVAQKSITDWQQYESILLDRMGRDEKLIRMLQSKAKQSPKKVVLSNAEEYNVLKAAQILEDEGIAQPILLGWREDIESAKKKYGIDIDAPIVDPSEAVQAENRKKYAQYLWEKGARKGVTEYKARRFVSQRDYFGPLMVQHGDADALLIGYSKSFHSTLKPIKNVIDKKQGANILAGMVMLLKGKDPVFLCDTSVNENTTAEDLVDIARMAEATVKYFGIKPRIAMLSVENFYNRANVSKKVSKAVAILHRENPDMLVDGEIQPDIAMNPEALKNYPFSKLGNRPANVFIFPDQVSANITYKMLRGLKTAQTIGPILLGMDKPVHIMQMNASIEEIVHLATLAVLDASKEE